MVRINQIVVLFTDLEEIKNYTIESLKASDPTLQDFELFRFEYFAQDIQHLHKPHRHHFYTFLLVTAGGGSHDIDFTNYVLKANRLFLIAPGQVHAWKKLTNVKGFVVLFDDTFITLAKGRKMMRDWPLFTLNQRCYLDLHPNETQSWYSVLLEMEGELRAHDEFSKDTIFYSLGKLLVRASRLYREYASKNKLPDQPLLYSYQELIEKNFHQWHTPKAYAKQLNITANYLNALCKEQSGKSAGALIRQRILLEAKRLLAHTQLSVGEIAYQLNFTDNSYFGRFFKRYTDLTPEAFRKKSGG